MEELTPFQKAITSGEESVSGVVIGGGRPSGRLYYEGRPQGGRFIGDTEDDVEAKGREALADIKRECGRAFYEIYPNRAVSAWEIRIYS
jgi:hypothetical protein